MSEFFARSRKRLGFHPGGQSAGTQPCSATAPSKSVPAKSRQIKSGLLLAMERRGCRAHRRRTLADHFAECSFPPFVFGLRVALTLRSSTWALDAETSSTLFSPFITSPHKLTRARPYRAMETKNPTASKAFGILNSSQVLGPSTD